MAGLHQAVRTPDLVIHSSGLDTMTVSSRSTDELPTELFLCLVTFVLSFHAQIQGLKGLVLRLNLAGALNLYNLLCSKFLHSRISVNHLRLRCVSPKLS